MTRDTRCAIVTGGARGIGLAVARRLQRGGFALVIGDRDDTRGRRAEARLRTSGAARFQAADVTREDDVAALTRAAVAEFGGIDVLVNNAAVADPVTGPLESLALADWERRIATNLTSAFLCSRHAVAALRERGGCIVNIASSRALQSEPDCEAYAASKGGLVALTHAMAVSLGPAVRVNAVSPGWINTSASDTDPRPERDALTATDHAQHPAGRVGRPEDVAEAVAWLVSAAAGFVTGQNLVVDGGMTRKMIYAE